MGDQTKNDISSHKDDTHTAEIPAAPNALPAVEISPSLAGYLAEQAAHEARIADLRPRNKTVLFDCLEAAGIGQVLVSFDGYGDSGQIESIEARDGHGRAVELPSGTIAILCAVWQHAEPDRRDMPLSEAIEHLAYDALRETHAGWENDDGAYGEFVFDVSRRMITLDYNERYTATESYSHEF